MYDKDEIKQGLTLEQVEEVILALGVQNYRIQSGVIMMENICHNFPGESSGMKLYYYDNTKLFRCYTECREFFDIFELIIKVHEIQFNQEINMIKSIEWLLTLLGIQIAEKTFDEIGIETNKFLKQMSNLIDKINKMGEQKKFELQIYDDAFLNTLKNIPAKSWIEQGITKESMEKYQIRYHLGQEKIVIPHRDADGNLIGVRGRAMIKEEAELYGKYKPIAIAGTMYNHPLSFALYGLYENKENIKRVKKVFIFESEKSVITYDSLFGSENNISVACCGSSISTYQIDLLCELGVEEIIIAFDKEFSELNSPEHKRNVASLLKLKNKFSNRVKVSFLYDIDNNLLDLKDSPIDKGKDIFLTMFKNRIII